ncbi:hypothetical protein [Microbacterium sp. P5_E9]
MDTQDRLDLLLERSAPEAVHVGDDLVREMDHVAAATHTQVADEQPRIRRMPRLVAGVGLAVLLTGGAGAAVAAGGFEWLPWAEDPDVAYAFTLPSGRGCEARIVLEQTEDYGDWDVFVADIGQLTLDDATVARRADEIRSDPRSIIQVLDANGQFVDLPAGAEPTEDDWYAVAHYVALTEETTRLSAEAGIDGWWTSDAQLQCEALAP